MIEEVVRPKYRKEKPKLRIRITTEVDSEKLPDFMVDREVTIFPGEDYQKIMIQSAERYLREGVVLDHKDEWSLIPPHRIAQITWDADK